MQTRFLPGIDILADSKRKRLKGRRIGLVSHPAAVSSNGAPSFQVLLNAGMRLTAIFGPEHGFFGTETAGEPVKNKIHPQLEIPVYSLYGRNRRPTPAMLNNIDAIVFDLQDLGARPYTYVSTLRYVLEAAAQEKKEVIVADRPIPLPRIIDGPMLDDKFSSFVGCVPAPMHYGMTPGETSLWLKQSLSLDLDLTVVPMRGYFRQSTRGKNWPPWIPPSPGLRSWETGYCYLATVFGEALPAINIGHNSNLAFQVFSAPGVKSNALCKYLNHQDLPGVNFYPHPYKCGASLPRNAGQACLPRRWRGQRPSDSENKRRRGKRAPYKQTSKIEDTEIFDGVRIAVCNPDCFHPVSTSVAILAIVQKLRGFDKLWRQAGTREDFFDKLYGTDKVRLALQAGEPAENIICRWQNALSAFRLVRKPFLLYK